MNRTSMAFAMTLASAALFGLGGCEDPTGLAEQRGLGWVAGPFDWPGTSPRSWIVEGRTVQVEMTTMGACPVTRTDWEVTVSEDLLFILPWEYRLMRCGDNSPDRVRTIFLYTDTLEVELGGSPRVTVRVVSGDGTVFDQLLDFGAGGSLR